MIEPCRLLGRERQDLLLSFARPLVVPHPRLPAQSWQGD